MKAPFSPYLLGIRDGLKSLALENVLMDLVRIHICSSQ